MKSSLQSLACVLTSVSPASITSWGQLPQIQDHCLRRTKRKSVSQPCSHLRPGPHLTSKCPLPDQLPPTLLHLHPGPGCPDPTAASWVRTPPVWCWRILRRCQDQNRSWIIGVMGSTWGEGRNAVGAAARLRTLCKYSEGSRHAFLPTAGLDSACKGKNHFREPVLSENSQKVDLTQPYREQLTPGACVAWGDFYNSVLIKCNCILETRLIDILSKHTGC